MEKVYSEKDVSQSGVPWGGWNFSLSEDKITERISSFCPSKEAVDQNAGGWAKLFSIIVKSQSVIQPIGERNCTLNLVEDVSMENAIISDVDNNGINTGEGSENVKDFSNSVVDQCNRMVPELRLGFSVVQLESESVITNLSNLTEVNLTSVMENAWVQLQSDESKLCFCIVFSSKTTLCHHLCRHILLPWFRGNRVNKLEQLSAILAREGDTVCIDLLAPLLQTEDSFWARSTPDVEELMSAMNSQHWTILLKELLTGIKELQVWQVPVLSVVVEKSEPSHQELHSLVQLMSSVSNSFDQNRDFGALVAAVASRIKPDSASLIPQLKSIVDNFKGSLKIMKSKTLKIIADISD